MKRTFTLLWGILFWVGNFAGFANPMAPNMFKDAMTKAISDHKMKFVDKLRGTAKKEREKLLQRMTKQLKAALNPADIYTGQLKCRYTRSHSLVWTDKGSGAAMDVGVWRPKTPNGWVRVGDVAVNSLSKKCPNVPGLLIEWDDKKPIGDEKGPYLKRPVKYVAIWNDKGSGADMDGSFWYPVPPKGYVSLGCVGNGSHKNPGDLGIVRCVRSDLVYSCKWVGQIYNDKKSGADKDVALWSFTIKDRYSAKQSPFLHPDTFMVAASHKDKPKYSPLVLKGLTPNAAFNSTFNGYINTTGQALVNRTILALENARNKDFSRISEEQKSFKNEFKTTPGTVAAVKPQAEEKLEVGETSATKLPGVKFSTSEFAQLIKDITGAGDKMGLNLIPGFDKIPFLKSVTIDKAVLSQGSIAGGDEQGQPWLCIDGNVSVKFNQFGNVDGRIILLTRLYKETGLHTGFVITLPTEKLLAKLGQLGQAPMKLLKLSDTAVTYATEKHEWLFAEVPERLKKDFAVFADDPQAVFPFVKGEGAWMTAEVKNNTLLAAPCKVLKTAPPKVMFNAIFPQSKDESFKIRAQLLSEFNHSFLPTGKFFNIGKPDLEMSLGDFQGLAMIADLNLKISSNLDLTVPARMDFPLNCNPMNGISVSGKIPGIWKNAMGIHGFSVGNLGISGSFGKIPSLGLGGIADLGDGWKFDLAGALSFASPVALSALKCKLNRELGLGDMIGLHSILAKLAFPKAKVPDLKAIDLPLVDLRIRDPYFCIAENDVEALKIRAGITCSGTLMLGNTDLGACSFWMHAEKGIQCKGWVRAFKLGPLALSGAGPDKIDHNGDDCAVIDLEYWPLTKPPFTLQQHCYISARADIGKIPLSALLDIKKDHLRLSMNGDFGSSLKLMLNATGESSLLKDLTKGASLQCEGEATSDFIDNLEKSVINKTGGEPVVRAAIAILGDAIINIRSIKFKGSLGEITQGKLPNVEIKGAIFGMSFSITDSLLIPASDILNSWVKKLTEKVIGLAGELVKDPVAFVGNAAKEVIKLGEDVGAELVKAFGRSPEKTWEDAQASAQKAGEEARKVAVEGAKMAAKTASQVVSKAEKTAKSVAKTMENLAKGAWNTISGWF